MSVVASVATPALPHIGVGLLPARPLDADSLTWWTRLHGPTNIRERAVAELHERLRCEARFHIQSRSRWIARFPRTDVDDLAIQAADDALLAVLRKLDNYRGDSQFWTWARRFAQLEAPVSIRRRMGRDQVATDAEQLNAISGTTWSPEERAEVQEMLRTVRDLIVGQLTTRQRTVLVAVAIDGISTATLAERLETTSGAIYKTLHDARKKLATQLAMR
jgi:RNA polymerase sigma-70 factor (ECF subfamily)